MRVAVIGLLIILTGCTSVPANYAPPTVEISEPPIGSINTVEVGEYMVRQGLYIERDAIRVTRAGESLGYDVMPGVYEKKGASKDGTTYYPAAAGARVKKGAIADPWSYVLVNDNNELCVITVFAVESCTEGGSWENTVYAATTDNGFQQSLIYSGKIGDKINIGYREFSNSIARPAFNNDVEYDLSESRTIGYRGSRLEVLDATNESITFKLISNFNKATR